MARTSAVKGNTKTSSTKKSVTARRASSTRSRINKSLDEGTRKKAVVVHDDDAIFKRLEERFRIIEKLTDSLLNGSSNSLILSGPPGVGKTFTVEKKINDFDPSGINVVVSKGYIRTTALFKILWSVREKGQVAVFDDADSLFEDLNSLNVLKAALDTSEVRKITFGSEYVMFDDDGKKIPRSFDFAGSVIFVTNYDFDEKIAARHKHAEHFKALMSRSHYVSVGMKSARDYIIRIKQVVQTDDFRRHHKIEADIENNILDYISNHQDDMRELSIRTAVKLIDLVKSHPSDWAEYADITCLLPR